MRRIRSRSRHVKRVDWFRRHFFSIDPRTLALTRVALGLLLLLDLAKRMSGLEPFYTDGGLLPRDVMQRLHPSGLSVFWHLGSVTEVAVAFAACGLAYVALTVGFVTPLAKVLSLAAIISLQARVQLLAIGGDIVVCLLCWWTLFLPLGRHFSVDAWLERRRGRSGAVERAHERGSPQPVVSIAAFGAILQLAVIYLFNALHKTGATWMDGTAIHYTLWLDRVVTPFAVWYRGILSPFGSELLTWGTLATEGALPFLIMSPWGKPWTRRLAILLIVGLHVGIAVVLNIGIFSAAMIAFATLLVSTRDWEELARIARRRAGRPLEVAFAADVDAPASARVRLVRIASELLAFAFFAQFVVTTLIDNWAVPESLKPPRPPWLGPVVGAGRLHQGWHMFSPDTGTIEMAMVIEAQTVGGRRVDPVAELSAPRYRVLRVREVPEQVGQDVYWHHYALRLPETPALHAALSAWLLSYHERTGRPEDRILGFRAFVVARPSPPPGSDTPGPPSERIFLRSSG